MSGGVRVVGGGTDGAGTVPLCMPPVFPMV